MGISAKVSALLLASALCAVASDWITVRADDGRAYQFYADGKFICEGKSCVYVHREDDCKILFSAEIHGRLYGKLEYGGGWAAERRSFLENLLISTATRSSEQKGCVALNDAVIHIDPVGYVDRYFPPINLNTDWDAPIKSGSPLREERATPNPQKWNQGLD